MQLDLLWAFILIFTIDSIAPGPAVAMVMSRGASVGLSRTLPFIAGLVIADLLLFLMALIGLVMLVKSLGPLFFLIKWIGIGYLLYLAYGMWTAKPIDLDSPPKYKRLAQFISGNIFAFGQAKRRRFLRGAFTCVYGC